MSLGRPADYCSFTKAVEHLGDRWSLLILADLSRTGPKGFNALAAELPGRISRSVLAERLRRLEAMGLVSRGVQSRGNHGREGNYRLTTVGRALVPTIRSLQRWASAWLPDDPASVERDPEILLAWLGRRVRATSLPVRRTVLETRIGEDRYRRGWLVLELGQSPYGCFEDPLLDETSYVYVQAATTVLLALARGALDWTDALGEGSVVAFGDPELIRQLPGWFVGNVEESEDSGAEGSVVSRAQ